MMAVRLLREIIVCSVADLQRRSVIELVTPPLDGMILPGVTRDSVLALARDHASGKAPLKDMPAGKLVVNERPVTMKEVKDAASKGQLVEFFGTGSSLTWPNQSVR